MSILLILAHQKYIRKCKLTKNVVTLILELLLKG